MNQTLGNIFGERRQKSIAGKYVRSQNAAATLWNAELPVKPTVSRAQASMREAPGSRLPLAPEHHAKSSQQRPLGRDTIGSAVLIS
jgi:hypothetical protein